jgi:NAD-dependent SIR2 family protein deacetylase
MDRFGKALCMEHQKIATAETRFYCNECKQTITHGEFKFSTKNFDMPLCRDCQPEVEEKVSAAPKKFQGTYKIEVNEGKADKKK